VTLQFAAAEDAMIEIRPATKSEIPALVELASGLVREDAGQRDPFANVNWPQDEGSVRYGQVVSDDDAACFVALYEGEPIGYISGRLELPSTFRLVTGAQIGSLFVLPAHRNQSVGEQLVGAFVAWAHTKGAEFVTVSAFASNDGALRFYQRVGFAPHSVTLQYTIGQT
jgi:ribosomal protein S18 acetylase RimI-like enzyme